MDEDLAARLISGTCVSPCLILYYFSPKFRPIRAILFAYAPIVGHNSIWFSPWDLVWMWNLVAGPALTIGNLWMLLSGQIFRVTVTRCRKNASRPSQNLAQPAMMQRPLAVMTPCSLALKQPVCQQRLPTCLMKAKNYTSPWYLEPALLTCLMQLRYAFMMHGGKLAFLSELKY